MAAVNSPSTLNGLYKRVYGRLENAIPDCGWFLENVEWDQGHMVGDSYHIDVVLRNEQGFTYGGSTGGAFALNASVAMGTQPAVVTPFEYVMTSQISYGAASRAKKAGPRAFASAMTTVIKNAMESVTRRLEISCHYGSSTEGIGVVVVDGTTSVSSTTFTIQFAEDQWAAGIWTGAEGALLQVYDEGDALELNGSDSELTVESVDFANRKILVSAASGLVTQVLAKNASGSGAEAITVYFSGAHDSDMVGIEKIFSNQTGSIHGIDASDYGLWAGNLFSNQSEALTHSRVMAFAAQLRARGLKKEELVLEVSPFTWADLHQEQQATRMMDESYKSKRADAGFQDIRYHSPNGGIRVVASEFVKGGEAFMYPLSKLTRIGSEDREWKIPGAEENPFHPVTGYAAAEMRIYSDQTVFCYLPAACSKIDNIVNSSGTTG